MSRTKVLRKVRKKTDGFADTSADISRSGKILYGHSMGTESALSKHSVPRDRSSVKPSSSVIIDNPWVYILAIAQLLCVAKLCLLYLHKPDAELAPVS